MVQEFWQNLVETVGPWLSQAWQIICDTFQYVVNFIAENPTNVGMWYTEIVRWVMPLLALAILLTVLKSMLKVKNPKETWAYLVNPVWGNMPIHHWECTVGRAKNCDLVINFPTVSRMQWALSRDDEGEWMVADLSGKGQSYLNGDPLKDYQVINDGDILSVGDLEFGFSLISEEENKMQMERRLKQCRPLPPWKYLALLTVFQVLTAIELMFNCPEIATTVGICFGVLLALMWLYVLICRAAGKIGFEPEVLVFFLCTIGLAVTSTAAPSALPKQTFCIVLGFCFFIAFGIFLRDLNRVLSVRRIMMVLTVVLLLSSILLGPVTYGAKNWISIFGISVQPSEFAKITFIIAGAASLDLLFTRKNLLSFILLSFACFACLGLMSDFGTALIFFVTFLVIAYLRSGDFATLGLICGGAAAGGGLILKFKPYIAGRFATWGHAWENASTTGFQQVRVMSAAASGGLIGVGAGCGWLKNVFAAETDLVFGVVCEEWGLIIGLLTIACIVCLAIFAVRICRSCRSAYYTIAACAATSLLVFQTILNVFGSLDIIPLTGVTFPFVSCGGSSMIASWGLLAFLKAADTRQNASFAVRKKTKTGDDSHIMVDVDESLLQSDEYIDNLAKRNLYRRTNKKINNDTEVISKKTLFKKQKAHDNVDAMSVSGSTFDTAASMADKAGKSVAAGAAVGGTVYSASKAQSGFNVADMNVGSQNTASKVNSDKINLDVDGAKHVSAADLEAFVVPIVGEGRPHKDKKKQNVTESTSVISKKGYVKSANIQQPNVGYGKPDIGNNYYQNQYDNRKKDTVNRQDGERDFTAAYNKSVIYKPKPSTDIKKQNYSKQEDYERLNRDNAKKIQFNPQSVRQPNPFAGEQFVNPYAKKDSPSISIDESMLADENYIAELLKNKDKGGK